MNKFRIWSLAAAVPLMASCGLIDNVKSQLNAAVGQLTAVSQGNLTELVSGNAESMEQAGQQLEQLKSGGAKPQADAAPSGFSLGGEAPGLRASQDDDSSVFDQISNLAECVVVTREDDPTAKIRKITSDYSECEGQGGTVVSTLTEDGGLNLEIALTDFLKDGDTSNGSIDWSIDLLLPENEGDAARVSISSDEQITVTLAPTAPLAKFLPVQEDDADAVPATVEIASKIGYEIDAGSASLAIDGVSTVKQGASTATLSFDDIIFDFDIDEEGEEDDGCNLGPASGSIKMSSGEDTLSIELTGCGTATQTNPDGSTESLTSDQVNAIFESTLKALVGMFENINKVVLNEQYAGECDAGSPSNNSQANATAVAMVNGFADETKISFNAEQWYSVIVQDAGMYFVGAIPEICDALWPFVCVYDEDGNYMGDGECGDFAGFAPPVELSAGQEIFIRLFDPWDAYQCQSVSLNVIAETSTAQPAQCSFAEAGEDFGGAAGECPLFWIGDGFCDQYCLDMQIWTATTTNPDTGTAAGTDDGGDCVVCEAGQAHCYLPGATAEGQCVGIETYESEGCQDNCEAFFGPGHYAFYDDMGGAIYCGFDGPPPP